MCQESETMTDVDRPSRHRKPQKTAGLKKVILKQCRRPTIVMVKVRNIGKSNADPEHESCPEKPSKIKGTTNMSTVLASSDVCAIQGQNVRTKIRASLWDMEVREILRETRHPVLPSCKPVANHPLYADPGTIG